MRHGYSTLPRFQCDRGRVELGESGVRLEGESGVLWGQYFHRPVESVGSDPADAAETALFGVADDVLSVGSLHGVLRPVDLQTQLHFQLLLTTLDVVFDQLVRVARDQQVPLGRDRQTLRLVRHVDEPSHLHRSNDRAIITCMSTGTGNAWQSPA